MHQDRIGAIQSHPLFQEQYALLAQAEAHREFCRHTLEHLLDVARLMYIYALEDGAAVSKEQIYAAALLHDIGRYEQLSSGTPHHLAGGRMAAEILTDCGFSPEEIGPIRSAIEAHRSVPLPEDGPLTAYLYRADKASRLCFACPARERCNWPEEKKNLHIVY